MRGSLLARSRVLTGCAGVVLAAGLAGCTTTTSSPSVSGGTLKVYVSVPPGSTGAQPAADLLDAERLAFQQAGDTVGKFTVNLVPVQGKELSDNARSAIENSETIAYVGELAPGESADSIGITNAQDVLQVSPTDTAVELTQSSPAVPKSPNRYYESLGTYSRTFARVVPTDVLEAKALVGEMEAQGVKTLYVTGDGSPYGRALAHAVTGDAAPSITIASSPGAADAVLFAGSSVGEAAMAFDRAAAANPAVRLFAPSALATDAFAAALSPAAQRGTIVSSPGFTPGDLPPLGKQFVTAFRAAYRHAPAPQAIFGYEAMAAVMAVLKEAGSSADNRTTVVHKFFAISNRSSALGTYSIDSSGDTSIAPFVLERVRGGTLVSFKAVNETG